MSNEHHYYDALLFQRFIDLFFTDIRSLDFSGTQRGGISSIVPTYLSLCKKVHSRRHQLLSLRIGLGVHPTLMLSSDAIAATMTAEDEEKPKNEVEQEVVAGENNENEGADDNEEDDCAAEAGEGGDAAPKKKKKKSEFI